MGIINMVMLFVTDYNRNDSEVVVASYYKTKCCQDFMSFEQFEALPGLHSIFKQHDTAEIEFHFVCVSMLYSEASSEEDLKEWDQDKRRVLTFSLFKLLNLQQCVRMNLLRLNVY